MTIVGRLGGAFNIEGEGFGDKGILVISERQIPTTAWSDKRIKGIFPKDLTAGKVVVKTVDAVSEKIIKEQMAVYPTAPAPVAAK